MHRSRIKMTATGAREMTQQLRVLSVLTKDPCSGPSNYTAYNYPKSELQRSETLRLYCKVHKAIAMVIID